MKKVIVTLYPYAELSEAAKAKALTSLADLNTMDDWYSSMYEDAKAVGIEITEFDLMSRNKITVKIEGTPEETAKLILENHGDVCQTYQDAKTYLNYRATMEDSDLEEDAKEGKLHELDATFTKNISNDYWELLQKDYDYRTSQKAIEESIEANEYLFTENGKVFSTQYEENKSLDLNIDYVELKKQKQYLLNNMSIHTNTDEREGLLNLIDAIQDHAVDVLGKDKNEVFNLSDSE